MTSLIPGHFRKTVDMLLLSLFLASAVNVFPLPSFAQGQQYPQPHQPVPQGQTYPQQQPYEQQFPQQQPSQQQYPQQYPQPDQQYQQPAQVQSYPQAQPNDQQYQQQYPQQYPPQQPRPDQQYQQQYQPPGQQYQLAPPPSMQDFPAAGGVQQGGPCVVRLSANRSTIHLVDPSTGVERKHVPLGQDRVQKVFNSPDGGWSVAFFKIRGAPQYGYIAVDLQKCEDQLPVEVPSVATAAAFDQGEVVLTLSGGERRFKLKNQVIE